MTRDGRLPFVVTTAVIAAAALGAATLGSLPAEPANQIATPLLAAWVIAGAYVLWPAPALTAWLVIALFVNTLANYLGDPLLHVDESVLPMLFLVALVRHALPARALSVGFREWALGGFLVAGIASSILAGVPVQVAGTALVLLLKAVAVFYVAAWTRLRRADVERAGIVLVGVAGVVLALAALELFDPQWFRSTLGLPLLQRARGEFGVLSSLFVQPGLFGWFTAFASLLLYANFLVFRRWWLLPAALALNVGTILSGRRRPLIGVAVAFLSALGWQWRNVPSARSMVRTVAPLLASAALLVAISVPFLGGFYASTVSSYVPELRVIEEIALGDGELTNEEVGSLQPRTALYAGSIAIARDRFPLGEGLGRYGSHVSRVFYSPAYDEYGLSRVFGLRQQNPNAITDTFWPMILGETGIIGLVAYAAFVGAIMVGAWRAGHETEDPRLQAIHLATTMVLALALVESLVAPTFIAPPVAYFVYAAGGAAIGLRARATADRGVLADGASA